MKTKTIKRRAKQIRKTVTKSVKSVRRVNGWEDLWKTFKTGMK